MKLIACLLILTFQGLPSLLRECHGYQDIPQSRDSPPSKGQPKEQFTPARYKSIRFGKSTYEDVVKAFGSPDASGIGTDRSLHLHYKNIWLTPGEVEFFVDLKSRIVTGMVVYPDKREITHITSLLGNRFITSRYDLRVNSQDDDGLDGVMVKHPQGKYKMLEYIHLAARGKSPPEHVTSEMFGTSM